MCEHAIRTIAEEESTRESTWESGVRALNQTRKTETAPTETRDWFLTRRPGPLHTLHRFVTRLGYKFDTRAWLPLHSLQCSKGSSGVSIVVHVVE